MGPAPRSDEQISSSSLTAIPDGKPRAENPGDLNFEKAKQEEHGKQMMLVTGAIKTDLSCGAWDFLLQLLAICQPSALWKSVFFM